MNGSERHRIAGQGDRQASFRDPSVFDAIAADYDVDFTDTPLGRMLRQRVWSILGRRFATGDCVLELACGTGEDAVWLARRGVRVTATDGSAEMVRLARAKVAHHGLVESVRVHQSSLEQLARGELRPAGGGEPAVDTLPFDGAFSNFGGLNAISDWHPLAQALGSMVRGSGTLVFVVMGPYCPWEIAWHLAHGRPGSAFRRFSGRATAKVGEQGASVWYPTAARLRRDLSPWFSCVRVESLGLWLPPTYLGHLVERWPSLFSRLSDLERASARLSGGWGDHYVAVFERNK